MRVQVVAALPLRSPGARSLVERRLAGARMVQPLGGQVPADQRWVEWMRSVEERWWVERMQAAPRPDEQSLAGWQ